MEAIIKEACETNFGIAYETYNIAVKEHPSTRLQDVKDFYNKLESVQTHFKYKKYNSSVSSKTLFDFEIDLMDMGTIVTPMRYGLAAVDNFTKVVSAIPIKDKQVNESMISLEEVFASMGKPRNVYSDEEGAMNPDTSLTFIHKHTVNSNTYEHQHMHIQQRGLFKHSA